MTQIHGVELIADGDMVLQHQRQTGRPFEAESVTAWKTAAAGGTTLDIGAYTGLYSLIAAKHGARSLAFEPNPAVFARLRENILANGLDVTPREVGISDRLGLAAIVSPSSVRLTSGGRLDSGHNVAVITVDSLELTDVTAMKIDVEGHECAVLRGALQTIERCSPLLITEALTAQARDEQADILCPLGYTGVKADQWNIIWRK